MCVLTRSASASRRGCRIKPSTKTCASLAVTPVEAVWSAETERSALRPNDDPRPVRPHPYNGHSEAFAGLCDTLRPLRASGERSSRLSPSGQRGSAVAHAWMQETPVLGAGVPTHPAMESSRAFVVAARWRPGRAGVPGDQLRSDEPPTGEEIGIAEPDLAVTWVSSTTPTWSPPQHRVS
jgi:hypothetical protein